MFKADIKDITTTSQSSVKETKITYFDIVLVSLFFTYNKFNPAKLLQLLQ